MSQDADLISLLKERGAILHGHFVLTSGRHSDTYIEKFRIIEQPAVLSRACAQIAEHFRGAGVQLVAGPTTGGIIIAFEVARQLGVDAIYVESENGVRKLRRGAHVPEGARVLVVDDVLTTGQSIRETIIALGSNAQILGVGVLIDRSEQPKLEEFDLFAACKVDALSYDPNEIPPDLAQIAPTKPGTRPS
jgi:orotate phosphoribosyltransferase